MVNLKTTFGKYWLIQVVIISTLLIYSLLLTAGIGLIISNPDIIFTNNPRTRNEAEPLLGESSISVMIIFNSQVEGKPITWDTLVVEINQSETLFQVMNSSLNLSGTSFGALGFLVEGINGLLQDNTNFWLFEYYTTEQKWLSSSFGVSSFIITSDSFFRWIYQSVN